MKESQTKEKPPVWYSTIDFGKVESFLKSHEGKNVVNETLTNPTPAAKVINEMTIVQPQKLTEPFTI